MAQPGAARPSTELSLRVLSSVVMAAAALGSAWIGGWLLALVWLGAAIAVALEWLAMARLEPRAPLAVALTAGLVAIQAATVFGSGSVLSILPVAAGFVVVAGLASGGRHRAWALAGLAYAAAVATAPVLLRSHGLAALLWLFAVVWTTDVAAYFVGRTLGGPKLWPAVSPNKTWSGFAGGLAGAIGAGIAVAKAGGFGSLALVAVASGLASVASQAGDLFESAMKRRFGVKDSGHLIPGHGGFMDRLDGFAAVCALVLAGLLFQAFVPARIVSP